MTSFQTSRPTVVTSAASNVSASGAWLDGAADPNGAGKKLLQNMEKWYNL